MIKHSEEFKREAVRIALASGLPRDWIASDLGIGKLTLGKWLSQHHSVALMPAPQADLTRENERLRLENRVHGDRRRLPSFNTSTVSTTLLAASHISAASARSRSNQGGIMRGVTGTKPLQVQSSCPA
jgi:transposase